MAKDKKKNRRQNDSSDNEPEQPTPTPVIDSEDDIKTTIKPNKKDKKVKKRQDRNVEFDQNNRNSPDNSGDDDHPPQPVK
ncbi:hypothetical protein BIW11_10339, partial [Tropilaelaps mercedesae]